MPLDTSTVRTQVTRVSDNLGNLAKELEERGTSLSQDGLKLLSAQLRAACAELKMVHTPEAISEEDVPQQPAPVASGNWASNTAANPSASMAPGTVASPSGPSAAQQQQQQSASKSGPGSQGTNPSSSAGQQSSKDAKPK